MINRVSTIEKSKRFQELKRITNDPKCGDHNVLQDPSTGELLMKKVFMANDEKTAKRYYEKYDARTLRNKPFLIQCYDFNFEIQSEFCSKFYILQAFYEYPYDDLSKQLVQRAKQHRHPPHEELTQLFYNVLEALVYMQTAALGNGYIQLYSIFKDNQNGIYKLIDNFSNVKIKEFYFSLMFSQEVFKLIAPELLELVVRGNDDNSLELSKIDVFHLGLIILSFGTLTPLAPIYDIESAKINEKALDDKIKEFHKHYGQSNPLLMEMLQRTLILDPRKRPYPSELKKEFPSYENFRTVIENTTKGSSIDSKKESLNRPSLDDLESRQRNTDNPFLYKYQFKN